MLQEWGRTERCPSFMHPGIVEVGMRKRWKSYRSPLFRQVLVFGVPSIKAWNRWGSGSIWATLGSCQAPVRVFHLVEPWFTQQQERG